MDNAASAAAVESVADGSLPTTSAEMGTTDATFDMSGETITDCLRPTTSVAFLALNSVSATSAKSNAGNAEPTAAAAISRDASAEFNGVELPLEDGVASSLSS